MRDAELGKRIADKVMKVWRLDGEEQYVFVHIEVQGDYDASFAQRMFIYHYRLYDRHRWYVLAAPRLICRDRPRERRAESLRSQRGPGGDLQA